MIGVSSFWQQNSPSFLQTMRKVNEVNFIGHPFILSFEKKKIGIKVLLLEFQKEKRRSIFFLNDIIFGNKGVEVWMSPLKLVKLQDF